MTESEKWLTVTDTKSTPDKETNSSNHERESLIKHRQKTYIKSMSEG
jgi:hypothetical protein